MFEGEFEEGIKHGSGKMNMNDGRVIKGIWIRGTYQGEENEDGMLFISLFRSIWI